MHLENPGQLQMDYEMWTTTFGMYYCVCHRQIMWHCNKNNAEAGLLRIVSQDYFKTDSKTDTTALRSKSHRITELFRLDEL